MALPRTRIGLALSGGGFRASFFHLGVLRRLAELDLLRHVATLSTVSGGSILGAHYYLHLKRRFEEKKGELDRDDYVQIIVDLERDFSRGNAKDLRNRLLMNVVTHIRALALGRSYGRPMSRLYAKHFFAGVTKAMYPDETFGRYGIPLHRAITEAAHPSRPSSERRPEGQSLHSRFPSSGYPGRGQSGERLRLRNRRASARIPHFVMNATCLNTGGRFTFMLNEVGGPNIGYVRTDEVFMLLQYKRLLDRLGAYNFTKQKFAQEASVAIDLGLRAQQAARQLPQTAFRLDAGLDFPQQTAEHLRFYLAARELLHSEPTEESTWLPDSWLDWQPANDLLKRITARDAAPCIEALASADLGTLRRAKIPAWYLLDLRGTNDDSRPEHQEQFLDAVRAIHPDLVPLFGLDQRVSDEVATLIVDFYYFRSAEVIDYNAHLALQGLTISRAVAASANFPPVFTPLKIYDLFDRRTFDFVSLTDGGVHDNQGIEAVVDDACDYIIVSDAGGLVQCDRDPADSRLPMMDRIIDVLMGGMRETQMRYMQSTEYVRRILDQPATKETTERRLLQQLYRFRDPVVFHITTPVAASETALPRRFNPAAVAAIRTDLDAFNAVERNILQYEGYRLADAKASVLVRHDQPFQIPNVPAPAPQVDLPRASTARKILSGSPRRFGRFSESRPVAAMLLTILTAAFLWVQHLGTFQAIRDQWQQDDLASGPRKLLAIKQAVHTANRGDLNQVSDVIDRMVMIRWLQTADDFRTKTWQWLLPQSFIAIVFIVWTAYIVFRAIRRRKRLPPWIPRWLSQAGSSAARVLSPLALLHRVTNVISLGCLAMFMITLHAKWLLGIIPLWSLAIGAVFGVIHFVFTPLWRIAGWIPPRGSVAERVWPW